MNVETIHLILHKCCIALRKGEAVVTEAPVNGVQVTHMFAMPHESEALPEVKKVDVHFITIGVDLVEAAKHKDALVAELEKWPNDRLTHGPSYIEVGAELGSQDAALGLFGLGEALDLWKVITPKTMHVEGPQADVLAGQGFVMISGFRGLGKEAVSA